MHKHGRVTVNTSWNTQESCAGAVTIGYSVRQILVLNPEKGLERSWRTHPHCDGRGLSEGGGWRIAFAGGRPLESSACASRLSNRGGGGGGCDLLTKSCGLCRRPLKNRCPNGTPAPDYRPGDPPIRREDSRQSASRLRSRSPRPAP